MPISVDVKLIANFSVNINYDLQWSIQNGNQLCQKLLLYGPGIGYTSTLFDRVHLLIDDQPSNDQYVK